MGKYEFPKKWLNHFTSIACNGRKKKKELLKPQSAHQHAILDGVHQTMIKFEENSF